VTATRGTGRYRLYGAKGSGAMIVEAAFARARVPVEFVDIAWDDIGWNTRTLAPLNPLGQVPTLVMPDGSVMTESAAIILHLADIAPNAGLVPPSNHPQRPAFLRWLVFLVSAVYSTFTYGDDPKRWLDGDEAAGKKLRESTDNHRELLWRHLEMQVGSPWFLGDTSSALDIYLWQMQFWRPGRDWFAEFCPKLRAIGVAMSDDAHCKAIAKRNGF
jgi:GST-like protein